MNRSENIPPPSYSEGIVAGVRIPPPDYDTEDGPETYDVNGQDNLGLEMDCISMDSRDRNGNHGNRNAIGPGDLSQDAQHQRSPVPPSSAPHPRSPRTQVFTHTQETPVGGAGSRWEVRRVLETRRRVQPEPRNYISSAVKGLIFSFNFLFWLIGMSVAGLGIWISVEKDKPVNDALDIFFDPSVLMCLAGCIIFSLGFFGCLGALRENICLLKTFHIMLSILLLIELLLGIFVFVFYFVPSVRQYIGFGSPKATLKEAIVRYRDDDDLRDVIDSLQKQLQCCGLSNNEAGYKDWQENIYFNCTEENPSVERCGVPHSCCIHHQGDMLNVMCGFDTTNKPQSDVEGRIYTRGCLMGFGQWLETNTIIIGAVCLGVMVPQILGICLSRSLIDQIQQQKAQWQLQT